VPDRLKLSFVIFDIWALLALNVKSSQDQKLRMMA